MKKFLWSALASSLLLTAPAAFAQEAAKAPLSPKYLQWVQERESGAAPDRPAPSRIDWSHLADNPPIPLDADGAPEEEKELPDVYMPKNVSAGFGLEKAATNDPRGKNLLPPVRDENAYYYGSTALTWLAPALDNMEINAIAQGIASAGDIRLSAMYPAYFLYWDSRPGKSFRSTSSNGTLWEAPSHREIVAFTSRQGAIAEADLPFPTGATYTPPAGYPEDYTPVLQLQEFHELGEVNAKNRNTIKKLIEKHGAVGVAFDSRDDGDENSTNFQFRCDDITHYTTGKGQFIYVTLVGWNDSFPKTGFSTTQGARPKSNGAWLARATEGADCHDGGYFWLSYEQYLDNGTLYIMKAEDGMRHYGYDDLGYITSWGECRYTSTGRCVTITKETGWGANVFQAESDEAVREVAFYSPANNAKYEVQVYNLGAVKPYGAPVGKTALAKVSGTAPYAGYHRVALPKLANVDKGQWFSLVLKMTTPKYYYPIVTETQDSSTPEVVVNAGESWHSRDGKNWEPGETMWDASSSRTEPSNIALKAFTVVQAPTILLASLPNAAVGKAYNATLTAKGGQASWVKTAGTLPPGLTVESDGRVTGTPTKAGSYGFTVKATNATGSGTKAIKITVGEAPEITTTTDNLPGALVNTNYSATLAAKGTKTITWLPRNFPTWLTLTPAGKLSGKAPAAEGTHTFTVIAMNDFGEASQDLTLTVGAKPAITTATLPGGIVNERYANTTLAATGTKPIKWEASGKLPDGLALSEAGVLSGTPTKQGTFNVTAKATNKMGSVTKALKIVIGERPTVTTTNATLPGAIVNTAYNATLAANGTKTITWTATGLPSWLTLTSAGKLSSKKAPATEGTHTFTVTAKNDFGQASQSLTLTVGTKPVITTTALPGGVVGTGYNATLAATGTATINWTATGKLPDGLALAANGRITGTPAKQGTFNVTFKAENKMGNVTKALKIVIGEKPAITTEALAAAILNANYSATLAATGTKTITWSLTGGSLPTGITLAANGRLSGKPEKEGNYNFTVTAKNDFGQVSRSLTLIVGTKPVITTTALPGGVVGTGYNATLAATGAPAPTWAVSSGKLPDGLTLAANGRISGTPTKKGTYSVTVKATNAVGAVTKALKIVITG